MNAAGDGDTVIVGRAPISAALSSPESISLVSQYHTTADPALIDQTIISGGSPSIYVDVSAANTTVQGLPFRRGDQSPIQFFAQGGQALDNFFDDTGSDAVSFENVGGVVKATGSSARAMMA